MRNSLINRIYVTSLTIFAMLFGAGNLMLPLSLGMQAGSKTPWAIAGFIITGVLLPLISLLTIIAFNGNYESFFGRLGKLPQFILILFCMMIIGPFVVMPRIVTLSYEMLQPFLPAMHVTIFAILFLALVFVTTYRPSKLLDIIGKILSPLKVISILTIVAWGIYTGTTLIAVERPIWDLITFGAKEGYGTLDVIAGIFFGSIIVTLMTDCGAPQEKMSVKTAVKIAGISGMFAALLLALVYIGMSFIGAFHGNGLEHLNPGQLFSSISFKNLGSCGAALIGMTVFLACFTTTVSLAAVVTDYLNHHILRGKLSYTHALLATLVVCAIISSFGLSAILYYSYPVILASYPIFIVITLCNALYKLFGFPYIKIPTAITALVVFVHAILPFVR